MPTTHTVFLCNLLLLVVMMASAQADEDNKKQLATYRATALQGGDAERGKAVFQSEKAACQKCHRLDRKQKMAGPNLSVIGDKYSREQLIREVLEPSARIHPDFSTVTLATADGQVLSGVLHKRTADAIELFTAQGKLQRVALSEVETQRSSRTSLMPADLHRQLAPAAFADLIAYLTTLRQGDSPAFQGLPSDIPTLRHQARLEPLHAADERFDHPVWIMAKPGAKQTYLIVEQQTRKIWQLVKSEQGEQRSLFADLSHESITGQYEGVMCLAFHPKFLENGKYYLNYHVREDGIFSPVIVERQATADLSRDRGGASRRLLKIPQTTDLHWGGMLAFGPDGYLYIGAGDGGPQEDPDGHGQDMSILLGKILRIDVDRQDGKLAYAIPPSNPFRKSQGNVRPEIWAYGFRMPWRFSWDSQTQDMWVGDIGQNLFEEVSIARIGENHGWNVYEGFTPFSQRYRRSGEQFTQPVISYRRKLGVSVTGGYVYRGQRSPSFVGTYIFGDFESKRIWALTQKDRQLLQVRQIGNCPEKPASFGMDHDGELFVVGYEGTIYRLILDDAVFE